jgi:K+-transporting ATPase KdpF subunit
LLRWRSGGYRIFSCFRGAFRFDLGADRRLRGVGAQEMTWAYALSGAIAAALVVYLVIALIRAEDL